MKVFSLMINKYTSPFNFDEAWLEKMSWIYSSRVMEDSTQVQCKEEYLEQDTEQPVLNKRHAVAELYELAGLKYEQLGIKIYIEYIYFFYLLTFFFGKCLKMSQGF